YLILVMCCSASVSIVLRLSEEYSSNKFGVLTGNYLASVILAFIALPDKNIIPSGGGKVAFIAGLINGAVFLSALLLLQINIRKNGTVLASTFAKLGMILPVILAIILLGERPTITQIGGILLVIVAILVINMEKGEATVSFKIGLLLQMVVCGAADGMSKVFEQIGERQYDGLFVFYTFFFALLFSLVPLFLSKQKLKPIDLGGGIMVGIPNYFATWLLLVALTKLPAYLVYPSYSVGTILVVSIISVFFLKDKMTRRQVYGCGLILAALVVLNL
ncbi:MAG: DMT family transporter, partial [Clostridium sp.]